MTPIEARKIRKPEGEHGFDDLARSWGAPDARDDRERLYGQMARRRLAMRFSDLKSRVVGRRRG